jgi:hypothetical protein
VATVCWKFIALAPYNDTEELFGFGAAARGGVAGFTAEVVSNPLNGSSAAGLSQGEEDAGRSPQAEEETLDGGGVFLDMQLYVRFRSRVMTYLIGIKMRCLCQLIATYEPVSRNNDCSQIVLSTAYLA